MTDENKSSYKSIFKATSLFGGVQFYQILIQIIRSKFVAVLLGPMGVGILGLLSSGMQLIQSFTNMGLASVQLGMSLKQMDSMIMLEYPKLYVSYENWFG